METNFWSVWEEFEVNHGNVETYKDMLRIQRSVKMQYTQVRVQTEAAADNTKPPTNAMEMLEAAAADEAATSAKSVQSMVAEAESNAALLAAGGANPDEIDLGDEDVEPLNIQEQGVPEGLYGDLKRGGDEMGSGDAMGAKERFKRRRG